MKLLLANNQSERFVNFYRDLQTKSMVEFDYAGYRDLLFIFDPDAAAPADFINVPLGRKLADYDGIYINGYLSTYELANAVAVCADSAGIHYVNDEMRDAPSLSKISQYAKLAAAGVNIPKSIAGTKGTLLAAKILTEYISFPAVLKRADADRGIDNFKLTSVSEMPLILDSYDDKTIWILQEYIPNDGFYLVSYYNGQLAFCIYRKLEARPDGNQLKAHMYKPKGGANASLIELVDVPEAIINTGRAAVESTNRQIASVDIIYEAASDKAFVLEVNYNPQLVTIETFKDVRVQAFLDNLSNI